MQDLKFFGIHVKLDTSPGVKKIEDTEEFNHN